MAISGGSIAGGSIAGLSLEAPTPELGLDRLSPSCCEHPPQCDDCNTGTTPTYWQVVLAGIANTSPTSCEGPLNCTNFNGTYVLNQETLCTWKSGLTYEACVYLGEHYLRLTVSVVIGGLRYFVRLHHGEIPSGWFGWYKDYAHTDCDLSGESLDDGTDSYSWTLCDMSGSTCTVTAKGPFA